RTNRQPECVPHQQTAKKHIKPGRLVDALTTRAKSSNLLGAAVHQRQQPARLLLFKASLGRGQCWRYPKRLSLWLPQENGGNQKCRPPEVNSASTRARS